MNMFEENRLTWIPKMSRGSSSRFKMRKGMLLLIRLGFTARWELS